MFCPECGKEIAEGRKFCTGCGCMAGGSGAGKGAQAARPGSAPGPAGQPNAAVPPPARTAQQQPKPQPGAAPPQRTVPGQARQQPAARPPQAHNTQLPPKKSTPPAAAPAQPAAPHQLIQVPPPPPRPGEAPLDDPDLQPETAPGDFVPYQRQQQVQYSIPYDPRGLTIYAVIMLILMAAGVPAVQYAASGSSGIPIQGLIESEKHDFSIYVPDGWSTVKDPVRKTGHMNAAAYYFRGNPRNPDIVSIIYAIPQDVHFPMYISVNDLRAMEPFLIEINEDYMRMLGMEYELLELKTYTIAGEHAIWMDGNAIKRGEENKRDFTFLAFQSSRIYMIKFMFEEIRVDEFWPEIKGMLDSIEFY